MAYDPLPSTKRRYKQSLKEAIHILRIEFEEHEKGKEPSEGLAGRLLEVIKLNQRLIALSEIEND